MTMDPFAKKMWRASFAFAGLLATLATALTVTYLHKRPRCGDRVVNESISPDRRWTAAVIEHRCGEDSPFITQINLRDGNSKLERGFFSGQARDNNVFSIEQDAAGSTINLQWNTGNELTVHCRHCDSKYVDRQETQHGNLRIVYDFSASR